MHRLRMIAGALLLWPTLAAGQSYTLAPTYAPGAHWEISWENTSRIKTTETPMGSMGSPGFIQEKGKAELRVLKASGGRFDVLDIDFGACESSAQLPGATRPSHPPHDLDRKKVHIERHVDPESHEEKFDVTGRGSALTPDIEDLVRATYCTSPFPPGPVEVGTEWKSERVDFLLGPKAKGEMSLRLVRGETTETGRARAVVHATGDATLEFAGSGGLIGTADLSVRYTFEGDLRVFLDGGQIESIDLAGPMELDHGGGTGQTIIQRGEFAYHMESATLAPIAVAAQRPAVAAQPAAAVAAAPAGAQLPQGGAAAAAAMEARLPAGRNPLEGGLPDPFAGSFKDGELVLALKATAAGYEGTLLFGGKIYPVAATAQGNQLTGSFHSDAGDFPLAGALDEGGTTLRFSSGRAIHTLRKETAANPLERPAAANPLETPARANPLAR